MNKLFLSIGAMRAGTTWLHHQLSNHHQLNFTPEKEIHFWAAPEGDRYPMRLEDRIARFRRIVENVTPKHYNERVQRNLVWYASRYLAETIDGNWYQNLFQNSKTGAWCADFSNLTSLLNKEGWRRVANSADEVRAIYTLRHPIERMWSQVKFHHMYGGLQSEFRKWSPRDYQAFFANPSADGHCHYAANINRAQSAIPDLPLKVLFFEDIHLRPTESLNEIEAFLEIDVRDYGAHNLGTMVNPSSNEKFPKAFIKFARPHHELECEALTKLGYELPTIWGK